MTPDLVEAQASTSLRDLPVAMSHPHDAMLLFRRRWIPAAIVLSLVLILYFRVIVKLVHDWIAIPDFSHGFLIPIFVAYIIWDRREHLRSLSVRQSWAGLPLVFFALLLLITGVFGADLFLSRLSFVFLMAGLVWTFAGRRVLVALALPLSVLLLAIPFPAVVFNQITFPLQLLATRISSAILPFLGVPVLRQGNVIQLPAIQLEVAEACSGIRSLMSLFTVAVIYGYLLDKSVIRRWLLAAASLPIAVAANVARIVGTGLCVQYWDPDKALGFFHEFSGWLMFVISLVILYFVQSAMRLFVDRKELAQ